MAGGVSKAQLLEEEGRPASVALTSDEDAIGGRFVFAANKRSRRARCWVPRADGAVLREVFAEVDRYRLKRPITVYGYTCTVSGGTSMRFVQVDAPATPEVP